MHRVGEAIAEDDLGLGGGAEGGFDGDFEGTHGGVLADFIAVVAFGEVVCAEEDEGGVVGEFHKGVPKVMK
jgi:hypothetical protein